MLAWEKINEQARSYSQQFSEAVTTPIETQTTFLKRLLNSNKDTEFGQQYNFANIKSVDDFQKIVPIQNYDSLEPYIENNFQYSMPTLSHMQTLLFEKTSGSSGAAKIIPYNKFSLDGFRHAIYPWLYNLMHEIPSIMDGTAYWSISPAGRKAEVSPCGIAIGVTNDAVYFGDKTANFIENTLSVPSWVSLIESIEVWRYISLRFLLCDSDLRLISVWSPTFLLQLVEPLLRDEYSQNLISDIANGDIPFDELKPFEKEHIFEPNPHRAAIIKQALSFPSDQEQTVNTELLWPKLKLISCWADASSQAYSKQLQKLFPQVLIQPKGLLATEGAITLPLLSINNTVLTVNSGFYEFISEDGNIYLCDQLVVGQTYAVLLTNSSGLYRYEVGDLVMVTAWHENTPCLSFVGRNGSTTDLCGEKITESFIIPYLNKIAGFTLLVPYQHDKNPHYRLYVDANSINEKKSEDIAHQLEIDLSNNPQYAYARKLQQLKMVEIHRCKTPLLSYEKKSLEKGMRLGDIKPKYLCNDQSWHHSFMQVEHPEGDAF